jgi:hypothetical protein
MSSVTSCRLAYHVDVSWLPEPTNAPLQEEFPVAIMFLIQRMIICTLKADSHIACRAAKGFECVFPIWFSQCGRVWFTLAMPRPCHPDHSVLLKATAQHGRRGTPCGLIASIRLLPAITRSSTKFLSDAYQTQMQVAGVIPNTDCHGRGKEW